MTGLANIASFREDGYVVLRRILDADMLASVRREALATLEAVAPNRSGLRWRPAPPGHEARARALFEAGALSDLAAELCGDQVIGIMADFNAKRGPTEFHQDAEAFRGVRINCYLDLDGECPVLHVLPGSHRDGAVRGELAVMIAPGDAVAIDLRVRHGVRGSLGTRLFTSFFYYAVPRDDGEADAMRAAIERNARFGRHLLGFDPYTEVRATSAPARCWRDAIRTLRQGARSRND